MIFLIADVHTEQKRLDSHITNIEERIERPLDERDTLICLGDLFGKSDHKASTLKAKLKSDRELVNYIDTLPFRICCIHGNHDNPKRVWKIGAKLSEVFDQDAVQVGKNIFYLNDGQIYEFPIDATKPDEDKISSLILGGSFGHIYKISGAPIMNRLMFRKNYQHLMFSTTPIEVDYVLAHDAPTPRLGLLIRLAFGKTEATDVLGKIEKNVVFYGWYYGHHHFDSDVTKWHHCLYRREEELTIPDKETQHPFNAKKLIAYEEEQAAKSEEETTKVEIDQAEVEETIDVVEVESEVAVDHDEEVQSETIIEIEKETDPNNNDEEEKEAEA